jgi:ClpP class serine protease
MIFLIEPIFFAKYKSDLEIAKNINLDMFAAQSMQKMQGFGQPDKPEKKYKVDEKGNAKFEISGVLNSKRSFLDMLFGYAPSMTYPEIIESLQEIENDPSIKSLEVFFNTPGGYSSGVDEVAVAFQLFSKPKTAYVGQQMASAGYYLGSQFDKIVATSEASQIGSIGTMVQYWQSPEQYSFRSSDAPKKNPDPTSEIGKKFIVEQLDEIQSLFLQRVSEGRNISIDKIKSDYGQGGVFLAKRALESGMIDEIDTPKLKMTNAPYVDPTIDPSQEPLVSQKIYGNDKFQTLPRVQLSSNTLQLKPHNIITTQKQSSPNKGKIKENKKMDINTLKSEYPEVFAQASKIGEEQEKNRVAMFNNYMEADPQNEKLIAICKQAIVEGKEFKSVEPQLLVALRDGKNQIAVGNAPEIKTSNVDPIQNNQPANEPEKKYDVKSVVSKFKEAKAFKGGF